MEFVFVRRQWQIEVPYTLSWSIRNANVAACVLCIRHCQYSTVKGGQIETAGINMHFNPGRFLAGGGIVTSCMISGASVSR
jgi:hypothetical protein